MKVEFIFPEGFNSEDESVQDMVSDVNAYVETIPEDATLLHLRLPDGIKFDTPLTNRIHWYMNQIREFLSVARPNVVTLCNQFDMQATDGNIINTNFEVPDEISKDTLMTICYNLLSVIDDAAPAIDTSVSEIILPG